MQKPKRSDWPSELQHPEVRGVCVGGCCVPGKRISRTSTAHAHTHGDFRGWICFKRDTDLSNRQTCLHELAHIVTREGHTKRWREFLTQLGGEVDVPARTRARVVSREQRADGRVFVTYSNGTVTCFYPCQTREVVTPQ